MFMTLTGKLSWQHLRWSAVDIYSKNEKNRSLSRPLGDLGVTYALHLWLVGKPIVDFIFAIIELFLYVVQLRHYKRKCVEVGIFEGGGPLWVQISEGRGHWCQKTRVIAVSCGIKISAVHHLVLSQYTHLMDGQTDRQNFDSNTVHCITCNRTVIKLNLNRSTRLNRFQIWHWIESNCFLVCRIAHEYWLVMFVSTTVTIKPELDVWVSCDIK